VGCHEIILCPFLDAVDCRRIAERDVGFAWIPSMSPLQKGQFHREGFLKNAKEIFKIVRSSLRNLHELLRGEKGFAVEMSCLLDTAKHENGLFSRQSRMTSLQKGLEPQRTVE